MPIVVPAKPTSETRTPADQTFLARSSRPSVPTGDITQACGMPRRASRLSGTEAVGFLGIDECAQLFGCQNAYAAIGLADPASGLERLEQLPCWMTRQSRRFANVLLAEMDRVCLACMSTAGMMQEHSREPPVSPGQDQITHNNASARSILKNEYSEILPPIRTCVQHAAKYT